jgi:hypothetical protein
MSGGTYDYAYGRISDLADAIKPTTALRRVFKVHLEQVSKACHDIEWVDSGDYAVGAEDAAIVACLGLGKDANKFLLKLLIEEAKATIIALQTQIAEAEKI